MPAPATIPRMARFTKNILPPGDYHAPQGVLQATPERLRSWAAKFRCMKAAGIRVPICWGHQPGAVPGSGKGKSARQYEMSRFNAGYIEDLRFGANGLEAVMDVPGAEVDEDGNLLTWAVMPDGRKVRCAIKEVSASIRDFRDGKGRDWGDAIMHVALVPLPVVGGQSGFKAADLGFDYRDRPGEIHLSLSNLLRGGVGLSGGVAMPEEMLDSVLGGGAEGAGGGMDPVQRCLGVLAKMGLHLPEDTNEGNLCERIYLVGNALDRAGVLSSIGGGGAGDEGGEMIEAADDELPLEDEMLGEDDEMGGDEMGDEMGEGDELPLEDDELDLNDEEMGDFPEGDEEDGVTVSGDSDGLPGDEEEDEEAVEEARPLMMGTGSSGGLVARTSLEKQLVGQVKRGVQEKRLRRLADLQKKGLPRHRAQQLLAEIKATPVKLARRRGQIVPLESRVDVELSTLEGVAQGGGWVAPGRTVRRAKRPSAGGSGKVSRKFIEENAASVSSQRFGK